MTTRDEQLVAAMNEIIPLLRTHGQGELAQLVLRLRSDYLAEPTPSTRGSIRRFFGGRGPFMDLYLSRDGVPLIEESESLTRLRGQISELAQEYRCYD